MSLQGSSPIPYILCWDLALRSLFYTMQDILRLHPYSFLLEQWDLLLPWSGYRCPAFMTSMLRSRRFCICWRLPTQICLQKPWTEMLTSTPSGSWMNRHRSCRKQALCCLTWIIWRWSTIISDMRKVTKPLSCATTASARFLKRHRTVSELAGMNSHMCITMMRKTWSLIV